MEQLKRIVRKKITDNDPENVPTYILLMFSKLLRGNCVSRLQGSSSSGAIINEDLTKTVHEIMQIEETKEAL